MSVTSIHKLTVPRVAEGPTGCHGAVSGAFENGSLFLHQDGDVFSLSPSQAYELANGILDLMNLENLSP